MEKFSTRNLTKAVCLNYSGLRPKREFLKPDNSIFWSHLYDFGTSVCVTGRKYKIQQHMLIQTAILSDLCILRFYTNPTACVLNPHKHRFALTNDRKKCSSFHLLFFISLHCQVNVVGKRLLIILVTS